ncbi:VWA domain-containing protein [bacterium]|nr:VWA domain-containing protein [bacterium]
MKTLYFFLVCCALSFPQLGFAQGATVIIDGSATMLTDDCLPYDGFNALPDGAVIQIREDLDADGPEASDPILTAGSGVGEWSFNQFLLNGIASGGWAGSFNLDVALTSKGRIGTTGAGTSTRIFLAVMQPNNIDLWWWTTAYPIGSGLTIIKPDSNSNWVCAPLPPVAPGENCGSVIEIGSLPFADSSSTVGLADDFNSLGNTSPDVIYSFVAQYSGMHLLSLRDAEFNTILELRKDGACPGTTQVAVNDDGTTLDSSNTLSQQSELIVRLEAGTTYFAIVDGAGAASAGSYTFEIEPPDSSILPSPIALCCTPLDLVFVIDTTGSMNSGTFDSAGVAQIKAAAVALAGGACGGPVDLRAALVRFGDGSRTLFNLQSNYAQVFTALYSPSLTSGGGWNYPEGSDEALQDVLFGNSPCAVGSNFNSGLFNDDCRLKIIVLLTDAPPAGCVDSYAPLDVNEDHANAMAAAAAARNIRICAVYRNVCNPAICDVNVDRVMSGYAATTGGRYAAVAQNNVQSAIKNMIMNRGQGGLAVCATTDDLYCDPMTGVQPSPTQVNVCVENFSSPPTNCGGSLSLLVLGGSGGSVVSISPSSIPLGTLAPNAQQCNLFTISYLPNPIGGVMRFRTSITGSSCISTAFTNICVDVPPCSVAQYQCCYCDSLTGIVGCAMTTSVECDELNGIWTSGLSCEEPCAMFPGIDIDQPFSEALTCSSGVIVPNPYIVSASIYNHLTSACEDVSVSLHVIGASGVTGNVLNSPILLGSMSGQTGNSIAFNVQLNNVSPAGGVICYNMITQSATCCTDSVVFCDSIPPCPCPYPECDTFTEPANDLCDQDLCVVDCGDTLCGNISPSGDVDWYWVFVPPSPSGCTRLNIDIFGDDTPSMYPYLKGLDPKLEIYHDDCSSRIVSAAAGGVGNDPFADPCLTPGIYKIRVTGENNSSGPYIFATSCEPCSCSAPCPEKPCFDKLVGLQNWWQLDEASGSTSSDIASLRHGTWINAPQPVAGMVGNALCFNGFNSVISSNHSLNNVFNGSFTLDCWFKQDLGSPMPASVVGKENDQAGFQIYVEDMQLCCRVNDASPNPPVTACRPGTILMNHWYHVAMVFTDGNPGQDELRLYVDGILAAGPIMTNMGSLLSPSYFGIGATQLSGFGQLEGCADEVELYRRALRQDEVLAMFLAGEIGKCKEVCHIPWDVSLCGSSNTALAGVTICNYTTNTYQYTWNASGVTPYTWQCPFAPPTGFNWPPQWNSPVTIAGPGCVTIPLTITAPPGLGPNDVSCYQVNIQNTTTLNEFCCKGSIWGRRKWCLGDSTAVTAYEIPVEMDTTILIPITNDADSDGVFSYTLEVMSADPQNPNLMINGLPAGSTIVGSVSVPMGQSGVLPIQLQMSQMDYFGSYDLMIGDDEDGDGQPEFTKSIRVIAEMCCDIVDAPDDLVIYRTIEDTWKLSWSPVEGAAEYEVFESEHPDSLSEFPISVTSDTTYTISVGVPALTKKFYKVKTR